MFEILLIRPGSTDYDQQGRVQGTLDVPLSEGGRHEVSGLIEQLRAERPEVVYYSPMQSAEETAEAIGKALDVRTRCLDKLQNLDHGLWQGMLIDDVKLKQPKVYRQWLEKPETVCPPEGETISAARKRAEDVLYRLLKKHHDGVVALVVPEPMASIVHQLLTRDELHDLWDTDREAPVRRIVIEPVAAIKG